MTRQEAISRLAHEAIRSLTLDDRQSLVEEWLGYAAEVPEFAAELDKDPTLGDEAKDAQDQRYDSLLLHALGNQWAKVSNAYLSERLHEIGCRDELDGPEPELLPCPCCSYRTLTRRGHYDLCPVCFWEDDGGNNPSLYSSPNHMTLEEGRKNFARFGACSVEHVDHVDPDGRRKFHLR